MKLIRRFVYWVGIVVLLSLDAAFAQTSYDANLINEARAAAAADPVSPQTIPTINTNPPVLDAMGTYWSVQTNFPPLPFPQFADLPVYLLDPTNHVYVIDDRSVDYAGLFAENGSDDSSFSGFSMMTSSLLNTSIAYGNPIYLTNMAATVIGSATTASFSIAGVTNFAPYDILTTTNMANSISNWTWLGIGYTSNNYTFSNQPIDQSYYILARPHNTMVVGWGADGAGQCDVPFGLT